jgi:peptide/nickel transport system substrate-binding protein
VLLARNPNYWKTERGRRLPYLDSIRMDIQPNREIELLRFRRGQSHFISPLEPAQFETLSAEKRESVRDVGASLDAETAWFNLREVASVPDYRRQWFRSRDFRLAISQALRRDDMARLAYQGHASAGVGPYSRANRYWFNSLLEPPRFNPDNAGRLLTGLGFRRNGQELFDAQGHRVEFSLVTNGANRSRERLASLMQQDLAALGIKLNIVSLDFPSLVERITKTYQYEACLLGMINIDPDPNGTMNVWLSSGSNHPWNPNQITPATPWEAEIDRLMLRQAATVDDRRRKPLFDRVQQIVSEEAPILYLVNRNTLIAVSPNLRGIEPSVLQHPVLWNAEKLWIAPGS